ncbi:hypothetical protein UFOVP1417_45 [uncultured Caudovirales phage]|uniref:Uncharacterized protein n=1 Tax=uncultured Caudovirales phage TaxID=2100421 RepID=A0A6J5NBP0_9CAUD|nr:hypothetical protein UFOVP664_42 [uncultured Caudovirales phage]CAB4195363.1 hypothetical protein UFOVP1303_9 [uncultured Caudovirales phage]CAB4210816.1 hypothetical protein UFOVP1417_45 [uncultured Caudovirales phage]CAB5226906.1 hypothetical protein UFOVP1517_66 [uncultured Caudovirales phage]
MARNPQQVDDEGDDDAATYPVSPARMQQFNANSQAAGAGGVQGGGPLSQGATPQAQPAGGLGALAAGQFSGLSGPYQALYQQMQQKADAQRAAQQEYLASMQKQEGALSQTGMSDLDRASMLFQAAGALGQTTRSGGFGETLGNVSTAMVGPLSKAAEAQRQRQQQLQQLQMARQKLGMEMAGTGGVDPAQTLALMRAQQEDIKASRGEVKPVTLKMADGTEVSAIFKNGQYYDPAGKLITDVGGATAAASEEEIPAEVRKLGPEGIKKWKERTGTKLADEAVSAQQNAETAQMVAPILKRAEDAYNRLHKANAIGPIQGDKEGWSRWIAARAGTTAEEDRQNYEQAMADLELWRSTKLKGQGTVTDFERKIITSSLPRLDAVNAVPGLNTFKSLNRELQTQIEKGSRKGEKTLTEADKARVWARDNPNDPRAAAILKRLGAE